MRNLPSAAVTPPGGADAKPPTRLESPFEGCSVSIPKCIAAAPAGPIAVPSTQYDGDFRISISTPSRLSPERKITPCAPSIEGEFGYHVGIATPLRNLR